jgi:hypothetical protein
MNRKQALAQYLGVEPDDLRAVEWDAHTFKIGNGNQEHMILTDREATQAARRYILESLWAFRAGFIYDHMSAKLQEVLSEGDIKQYCAARYEDANPWIAAIIRSKREFVADAIRADGRGHFMSSCDGEEHEIDGGRWYVYRIN